MTRREIVQVLAAVPLTHAFSAPRSAPNPDQDHHIEWVDRVLTSMLTIKRGMTRARMLTLLKTEGGLSSGLSRTFVSQECPYFKVDVTFRPVGRAEKDTEGRVTGEEDDRDIIESIFKPYLAWSIMD